MTSGLRLGRVLGIPIQIHWSILAVVGLFTLDLSVRALPLFVPHADLRSRLIAGLIGVTLFFASILAHELGHALTALGQGIGVSGITLWLLGGMAQLDRPTPTARAELQVAAAGPAVSALLAVFFGAASIGLWELAGMSVVVAVGAWLALVNGGLAVLNLLPAAPLDGGRILTAVLWKRLGQGETARVQAGRCGLVLGVLLIVGGVVQAGLQGLLAAWSTAVVGAFVFAAARSEIASAVVRRRLQATPVSELLVANPPAVPDSLTLGDLARWAGRARGDDTAYPVVRWDPRPIGYVVPGPAAAGRSEAQQSFTRLSQVMTPAEQVERLDRSEPAAAVVRRWGGDRHRIALVFDGHHPAPLGTLTYAQIRPLLARPGLWGRDRAPRAA